MTKRKDEPVWWELPFNEDEEPDQPDIEARSDDADRGVKVLWCS